MKKVFIVFLLLIYSNSLTANNLENNCSRDKNSSSTISKIISIPLYPIMLLGAAGTAVGGIIGYSVKAVTNIFKSSDSNISKE